MKENQQVEPRIRAEEGIVEFWVRGYDAPVVLHMDRLHPDIIKRAALVGMAQVRIVDAAAVGMTDDEGNILAPDVRLRMKRDNMARLVEHYESGTAEWGRKGGTGTGGGARSITVEAIGRVLGVDYETASARVDAYGNHHNLTRKQAITALRQGADVQAAMQAIRAERAAATPQGTKSAADMLAELG